VPYRFFDPVYEVYYILYYDAATGVYYEYDPTSGVYWQLNWY